jgi:hypothetical protein
MRSILLGNRSSRTCHTHPDRDDKHHPIMSFSRTKRSRLQNAARSGWYKTSSISRRRYPSGTFQRTTSPTRKPRIAVPTGASTESLLFGDVGLLRVDQRERLLLARVQIAQDDGRVHRHHVVGHFVPATTSARSSSPRRSFRYRGGTIAAANSEASIWLKRRTSAR